MLATTGRSARSWDRRGARLDRDFARPQTAATMQVGPSMLTIRLLGDMAVLRGGEPLALPPSKKTRALLAYLVATGRPQRRERLCTPLWEGPDDPRGALRWSLSRLRSRVDE